MKVNKEVLSGIQEHLGFSDEEMELFGSDPVNEEILTKSIKLLNKTIVIEVVEAHGCNSGHKVGDKFYFDGFGNLLTKLCPSKICLYALSAVEHLLFAANELFLAGVDPNDIRLKRAGCIDIGLKCGGWGKIIMEIRIEKRSK